MIRAQAGQWVALWKGGRLMDVSHIEYPEHVSDSIEALPSDMPGRPDFWAQGGPFSGHKHWDDQVTPELVEQALDEWVKEYGPDHRRQLGYER